MKHLLKRFYWRGRVMGQVGRWLSIVCAWVVCKTNSDHHQHRHHHHHHHQQHHHHHHHRDSFIVVRLLFFFWAFWVVTSLLCNTFWTAASNLPKISSLMKTQKKIHMITNDFKVTGHGNSNVPGQYFLRNSFLFGQQTSQELRMLSRSLFCLCLCLCLCLSKVSQKSPKSLPKVSLKSL